jgi:hypothetical protein
MKAAGSVMKAAGSVTKVGLYFLGRPFMREWPLTGRCCVLDIDDIYLRKGGVYHAGSSIYPKVAPAVGGTVNFQG